MSFVTYDKSSDMFGLSLCDVWPRRAGWRSVAAKRRCEAREGGVSFEREGFEIDFPVWYSTNSYLDRQVSVRCPLLP